MGSDRSERGLEENILVSRLRSLRREKEGRYDNGKGFETASEGIK